MFDEGNQKSPIDRHLQRRDSTSSVKSLVSYHSVRESLGKMHAYVERVSKLDKEQSLKKSESFQKSQTIVMAEKEKLNRSHVIECINELDGENEMSQMNKMQDIVMEKEKFDPFKKRRSIYNSSFDSEMKEDQIVS